MTTSGSVDHSVTRDNIITDALSLVGAIGPDDTAPTNWVTQAARILNNQVKANHALGIGLWARKTGYILPVGSTNEVLLGPSGGAATTSYTQTTLSADAASGASTISVTSATGFSNGYYIGVELDDGTVDWTTINGAPSGTTVTLTAVLTGAASSGNYVYAYQTKITRPIRIVDAYVTDLETDSDIPIEVITKSQYDLLGMKSSESTPNQIAYEPLLTNGKAYFYPRMSDGKSIITIIFQRPFEDFDAAGDTPDFPQEAYDVLVLLLATRLAPIYGMPANDRAALQKDLLMALDLFKQNDTEEGSYYIQPDMR